jgi:hypothetical protein
MAYSLLMIDEGPSAEDLDRFGGDTGHCPSCGAEIWDQAEVCPECGEYIVGGTRSRPPLEDWFRRRWMLLIIAAVIVAFLLLMI